MPYNESYGPVRRMEDFLRELLQKKETVDFPTDKPSSLAYKLREAIHASQFWDSYDHYHQLTDLYVFHEREGYVRARYIGIDRPGRGRGDGVPTSGTTETQPRSIPEVESVQGMVGAALQFDDSTDEIRFPNAVLMESEKERLYSWAEVNDWQIIDHEEGGMTLTRRDVAEMITWKPEEADDGE